MFRMIGRLALCVLLLSGLGTATAQTYEQEAYDQGLQKLKRERPAEYEKQRRLFIFVAQMLLGRLGYDAGPFDGVLGGWTQAALELYQKSRGLPVTRDPLSFETNKQISADFSALEQQTVSLPQVGFQPGGLRLGGFQEGFAQGAMWTVRNVHT